MVATETNTQTGNWEIATACDLRLAPVFAGRDEVLEIDEGAIRQSLDTISPVSSEEASKERSVVFTATSIDDPRFSGRYAGQAIGIAWFDKENHDAHALVGVAGTTETIGFSFNEEYMALGRKILNKGMPGLGLQLYDIEPEPIWRKEDELQRTSVHELQHAADYHDTDLAEDDRAMRRRYMLKARATLIGSEAVAPLAVLGTMAAAQANRVMMVSAFMMTFALGRRQATRSIRKLFNEAYDSSTLEQRAFATADIAGDLPQIISIKSI